MSKILVIEDEENIRELIKFNLESEGHSVVYAEDGEQGLKEASKQEADLLLLDLMLPKMEGYDVLKSLRSQGVETPVIILTAKNDEADKVIGLEFGADDYITKPFSVRELKARIKAVLRRYDKTNANDSSEDKHISSDGLIQLDDLIIDIPAHEVTVSGKKIELSNKEFQLLKTLAENRGRVITRDQLLDLVWGYEYYGETRTVDVHVRYIRKKLGSDDNKYITTVRGVGYKVDKE